MGRAGFVVLYFLPETVGKILVRKDERVQTIAHPLQDLTVRVSVAAAVCYKLS